MHRSLKTVLVLALMVAAAAAFGFKIIPTGFLPNEDQGYFFVNVQLPDGARGGCRRPRPRPARGRH